MNKRPNNKSRAAEFDAIMDEIEKELNFDSVMDQLKAFDLQEPTHDGKRD